MQPPSDTISVKAFMSVLNETLSFAFPVVVVEGEVSSFKVNQGKWVFFDLKEDDVTLPCFMPLFNLKVPLEDGMKVRVSGGPKLTKWGKFSFTARHVELAGEGELKRAFELLKRKLDAEGLFAAERKRALPEIPRTIGLITSGASAAYADFVKILAARWSGVTVQLADIQVQGAVAPDQVCNAIAYFNRMAVPPDVLVIIRGGGSLDDLQAFSTEAVARAVAASRVPTVVGVGHEVDVSLADLAADRRAATPTDAARIVVPDRAQIIQQLEHAQTRMYRAIKSHQTQLTHTLSRRMQALERFVHLPRRRVVELESRLRTAERQTLTHYHQRLATQTRLLASFDPAATLKRGYAIVRHEGAVLRDAEQVSVGDSLVIQLAAGTLNTVVDDD